MSGNAQEQEAQVESVRDPARPSAVEGIKAASRQLRGTIREELASETDHFSEQNKQLLKFHGSYQQDDRDARKTRRKEGVGKHYMFMVRCKIPGGRLTAKQYLAMDDLAGRFANGTLRFTTRQGIQLHGVLKTHLQETIAGINECLLSTLGACGDVERNVMACPAPHHGDGIHRQLQETAAALAAHLAPRTHAYHEIWLNGKALPTTSEANGTAVSAETEPLYGKVYLPRKFKTGLATPRGQLHRHLRPGSRLARDHRGREDRRIQRARRRRHGYDSREREHVSAPRRADLLHPRHCRYRGCRGSSQAISRSRQSRGS